MTTKRGATVGRFSVPVAIANYGDVALQGHKPRRMGKIRRVTIDGVVDSGAVRLVLPATVVKELGLPTTGKIKVRYADGRRKIRSVAEGAYVELLGRHGTFTAIVEPKRRTALIGAIVLEDLDLLVGAARPAFCHQRN